MTETKKLELKKWKTSLTEEELDYLDDLKRSWEHQKKPSMLDDVKTMADALKDMTSDKILDLTEKEEYLENLLDDRTYIRRKMFLRDYRGNNKQQDWDYTFQLSDMKLRERLADIKSQLDNFRYIHKILNPKDKENKYVPIDLDVIKQIPITDFYREKTKTSGGKLIGKCPFHNEKTGSFTIYTATNSFHCFGCQESGTVIDFYSKMYKIDIKEAIKQLNNYL